MSAANSAQRAAIRPDQRHSCTIPVVRK
jgi:hypothetical protein